MRTQEPHIDTPWSIKLLNASHRPALAQHFLALSTDDRRLRFGNTVSDDVIRRYVASVKFEHSAVLGLADDRARLIGVAHLVRTADFVEAGLSVSSSMRGSGIATALLARARKTAQMWGAPRLFMHYMSANAPMRRLVRRQNMLVVSSAQESDAWLNVPSRRHVRRPRRQSGADVAAIALA